MYVVPSDQCYHVVAAILILSTHIGFNPRGCMICTLCRRTLWLGAHACRGHKPRWLFVERAPIARVPGPVAVLAQALESTRPAIFALAVQA